MSIEEKQRLFEGECPELLRYIWSYVSPRVFHVHDRADVVADIFLHAYESLRSYSPEKGSMRQWITGIAHYRILHYIRDRKSTLSLDEAQEVAMHTQRELEAAFSARLSTDAILDSLSHEQRALLTLHLIDGISLESIARETETPPATIRKRFSRLRKFVYEHRSHLNSHL